jgi:AcrR family transcriptional regulator
MNERSFIKYIRNKDMSARISKKEKKTEERRKQILDAAIDIFSQKGFAAATIPEIAEAAGLAAGTLYLYFPNKRDLFMASIKNLIFTTSLLNLLGKIPTGNIEEVFKKVLLNRFELVKDQHGKISRMPTLVGEILRDPELKEMLLDKFLHPFLGRMEAVYRMFGVTGKVRRGEPAVIVRTIGGAIVGFLILRILEGDASPINKLDQEKVAEDVARIILYGLLSDNARKKAEKDGKK